jgi:hypothetical protein
MFDQHDAATKTRRIHPISLFLTPKHKSVALAARRDQHAALEIVPALLGQGFGYGEPILDYPPRKPPPEPVRKSDLHKVDLSFVAPGDVLLQTTRPPMHDRFDDLRKRIRQSYTDLEDHMFDVWDNYIAWNSRGRVLLHKRLHHLLQPPHENKRQIIFRESQGAPYLELADCTGARERTDETTERRTAVFLLRKEEAWPGGPGLIGAFGMDATATAVWCYRLGRDLDYLLARPGFVFAEMTNPGIKERPTNMLCARDWAIEVLVHAPEG